MTLEEFKEILNKDRLNHFDKSVYVYILRSSPLNKRNRDIAKILNEAECSVSNLYRYAMKEKQENSVVFNIVLEYVNSKIPELPSYKEMKVLKLIEARNKVDSMRKQKRIAS